MIISQIDPITVKKELYESSKKSHFLTSIVGMVLNVIWFVNDYLVVPEFWVQFLIFRLSVSAIILIAVVGRKKFNITIHNCVYVLAIGISIQNAYMWSIMDLAKFEQQTLAYIALFIGVGMLALWEVSFSIALLIINVIANFIFLRINSNLTFSQIMIAGGMLTSTVAIFSMLLLRFRYKLTSSEISSRLLVEQSKELLEKEHEIVKYQSDLILKQKEIVDHKNKQITDSINYSRRIQRVLLSVKEDLTKYMPKAFVYYKPKDIVSGDFLWVLEKDNHVYTAVVDCTGHGVPGALMSIISFFLLEKINDNDGIMKPGEILDLLDFYVKKYLRQDTEDASDGCDVALSCWNRTENTIMFAGAHRSLVHFTTNNDYVEYKGSRRGIGGKTIKIDPFLTHYLVLKPNETMLMYSDGLPDQFGGEDGKKKFGHANIRNDISTTFGQNSEIVEDKIHQSIEKWKNGIKQLDDILIIGLRL